VILKDILHALYVMVLKKYLVGVMYASEPATK
jgi:hypothetical protein